MILPVPVSGTAGINKGNILQNLLCDFANFASGKPNFARKNFVGLWKFHIFAIGERNKAFEFLTFEKEEQKETKNNL